MLYGGAEINTTLTIKISAAMFVLQALVMGQPGHLTGTHRRRKSVRFAAAAPPIRYHFRINYLPLLCREKYHQAAMDEFSDLRLEIDCAELDLHLRPLHFLILL